MATIWMLRHAKATKDDQGGPEDKSRPLTKKGLRQATALGEWIDASPTVLDDVQFPELVVCSTALRCQQTLQTVVSASGLRPRIEYSDTIYTADVDGLRYLLTGYAHTSSLLLCGHEPYLGLLREDLLKEKHRSERETPVCSLAIVEFPADVVSEIVPGTGRLVAFIRGKSKK